MQASNNADYLNKATHLAQLLDGEIEGTPLEGSFLTVTLPYLIAFIKWLHSSPQPEIDKTIVALATQSFSRDTTKNLATLMNDMSYLLTLKEKIDTIAPTQRHSYNNNDDLDNLTERLMPTLEKISGEILQRCKIEKDVYFPGGWASTSEHSGHQMLYRLILDNNHGVFHAYNTGAGINYHGSVPRASGKAGYYPVFGFTFDYDGNDEKLSTWLSELLKPLVLPTINSTYSYNAKKLYESVIIPSIKWLDGKKIPGEELAPPILGQRSGTCVFKSLMLVIQTFFHNKSSYRQFLLAYRLYLLRTSVDDNKLANIEVALPGYQKLLNLSLANTTRMLDENLKPYIQEWKIDDSEKNIITKALSRWQKTLDTITPSEINFRVQHTDRFVAESKMIGVSSLPTLKTQPTPTAFINEEKNRSSYFPEKMSFAQALTELNKLANYENNFCEAAERFCFTFADPKHALLNNNHLTQYTLFNELDALLNHYLTYRADISPRSLPIFVCLIYMMDRLCEEGAFTQLNIKLSCVPWYSDTIHGFIKRLLSNPFLSTMDVQIDTLYEHMLDFYDKKNTQYAGQPRKIKDCSLEYYCSIIANAPTSETDFLKSLWELDQKDARLKEAVYKENFPSKSQYCFSYLKEEKRPNTTYELNKAFSFQETIETFLYTVLKHIALMSIKNSQDTKKKSPGKSNKIHFSASTYASKTYLEFHNVLFSNDHDWKTKIQSYDSYSNVWLLKPTLFTKHFSFQNSDIQKALTSNYDGNNYNSLEINFEQPSTLNDYFVDSTHRHDNQISNYSPLTSRSNQQRLASFLHQLHISHNCQVTLLLSELIYQPTWLLNEEFQQYIKLTVFQPAALLRALANTSNLNSLLKHLLEQNRFTEDPAFPGKAEWFILKLTAAISRYTLDTAKQNFIAINQDQKKELLAWQEILLTAINTRLAKPTIPLEEQREYHTLRLRTLFYAEERSNTNSLLESYIALMFLPTSHEAGNILEEENLLMLLEKINNHFIQQQKEKGTLIKLASSCLIKLLKNLNWDGNWELKESSFPLIILQDEKSNQLEVNLLSRSLTKNGKQLSYLPLSVMLSPEHHELFGTTFLLAEQTSILLNDRISTCYSFIYDKQEYRVLCNSTTKLNYFQQKISNEWYTYATPSQAMAKNLGFAHAAFDANIPPLFEQASYRVWVASQSCFLILDRTTQQICYSAKNGALFKLNTQNQLDFGSCPEFLTRFENKQFIEQIAQASTTSWHLPRYDLTIIPHGQRFQTLDKQYIVETPAQDYFGTGLIFRAQDNTKEDLFLVPLQPFYFQKDESKNSIPLKLCYSWVHDLATTLTNNILKKIGEDNHFGWTYTANESYVSFPIRNNIISPRSAADQIYLAYLYLAQDQTEKSFKLLTTCQLQGTPEEMERLWWIITKLPVGDTAVMNSRIIAVQMQALYMMLILKQQFPLSSKITNLKTNSYSNTQYFREEQQTSLLKFVIGINEHINDLFSIYDNRLNNIPYNLRLKSAQVKFLLSYYHAKPKPTEEKQQLGFYNDVIGTRYLENFQPSDTTKSMSEYTQRILVNTHGNRI